MSKLPSFLMRLAVNAALLGVSVTYTSGSAFAEPTSIELSAVLASAEEAYQLVDFDRVYTEASRGLALGNASVRDTTRLHVLLGISAASLCKEDESKEHFVAALALSPSLRLEQTLSPKLRGPYLEARGFWEAYPNRLSLTVSIDGAGRQLHVTLEDPARLGHTVRLSLRQSGARTFTLREIDTRSIDPIPIPPGLQENGFEYYGQVVDAQKNVLYELGNARSALTVRGSPEVPLAVTKRNSLKLSHATSHVQSASWIPQGLAVGGLAALGVGAVFNYRSETLAKKWNSPSCEQPGQTRLSQCTDVNSDRKLAERVAIGLYAGGGLLVAGGIVSWLFTRGSNAERESTGNTARAPVCQIHAWNGVGASCIGSF